MYKEKQNIESGREPIRVGISAGDLNGIGLEVIIKALRHPDILFECTPIVYASSRAVNFHKTAIKDDLFIYMGIKDATEAHHKKVNVLNCWSEIAEIELGKINQNGGKYAYVSLEHATRDLASGKIDVLVTGPISKEAIYMAGFKFPGHTEYLAHLSGQEEALMMMVCNNLRVALVTTHLSLKEAIENITQARILSKIEAMNKSLQKDFGIIKPRIAVFGLNPHAGERGAMGNEESEIITPAIQRAMEKGILAFGPYPSDGFFGSRQYTKFDGVLAMYHDQGLTGFKSIAFDEGVNFTAGLPIVRTSPDHGTAFDIAGKGIANEQSMRSAIYLACDVFRKRKFIKEIYKNPLPFGLAEKEKAKGRS